MGIINDTKLRIMESAFKLYLKNGLTDVSNSELKKEANITSGGFYHYFPSKDDLLNETVEMFRNCSLIFRVLFYLISI